MRKLLLLLIAVSIATTAFAIQPAQAQVSSTSSGVVCLAPGWEESSECYEIVPGATVRLQGGGVAGVGAYDQTTTSDDEGQFQFQDAPDGDLTLTITRDGFEDLQATVQRGDLGEFVLSPLEVEVSGTVVDSAGKSVSTAYIRFSGDWQYGEAKADNGAFDVVLMAGWYHVSVEAPGRGFLNERLFIDGSDLQLELGKLPNQNAMVSGRVVDQDGQAVADAEVIAEQWEARTSSGTQYGDFRNSTMTDGEGRYAMKVYAGGLNLRFQKEGHATQYHWLELKQDGEKTVDVELLRYPEKTAKIEGKITGIDGKGLRYVSISLNHPQYGIYECSMQADEASSGSGSSGSGGEPQPMPAESRSEPAIAPYPYYQDCAIKVRSDGSFEAMVTPGYAILNVHHDHWRTCSESRNSDGSMTRSCGPQYFSHVRTLDLPAEETTKLSIALKARPAPNAIISGYVVDGETQKAIPQVHVSFNNEETYGWGSATTDGDGSYKVKLHGGLQRIHVWADGYLPWEGMVDLKAGDDRAFDIILTPGQQSYGGHCCYAYAEDSAGAPAATPTKEATPPSAPAAPASGAREGDVQAAGGSSGDAFEDLGGGLGPYDPAKRASQLSAGEDVPIPVVVALAALGLALLARRRSG